MEHHRQEGAREHALERLLRRIERAQLHAHRLRAVVRTGEPAAEMGEPVERILGRDVGHGADHVGSDGAPGGVELLVGVQHDGQPVGAARALFPVGGNVHHRVHLEAAHQRPRLLERGGTLGDPRRAHRVDREHDAPRLRRVVLVDHRDRQACRHARRENRPRDREDERRKPADERKIPRMPAQVPQLAKACVARAREPHAFSSSRRARTCRAAALRCSPWAARAPRRS